MSAMQDMTKGGAAGHLLRYAVPLMLGNWFQLAYNAVDSIIAGRFIGKDALAAEGIAGPVMNLVILGITGVCLGAGVLMSEFFGAKDGESLRRELATTVLSGTAACTVVALLGVLFTPAILQACAVPREIFAITAIYLRITFLGAPFTCFYNALAAGFKSVGDARTPLRFLMVSAILNAALDLIFIGGLGFGIVCSAMTTVIAEAFSAVLAGWWLWNKTPELCPRRGQWRVDRSLLGRTLQYGGVSALQQAVQPIGKVLIQGQVNALGVEVIAAFNAVTRIDDFACIPEQSIAQGITTYIAQNRGAGRQDRIRRGFAVGLGMEAAYWMLIGGVVTLFKTPLAAMFVTGEGADRVIALAVQYLGTMALFYLLPAMTNGFQGYYRGITNLFGENAGAAFGGVVTILQSIMGVVGQIVTFATGTVKPIIQDVFAFITGTVLPIILQTFTAAAPTIASIITNLGSAVMTGMQIIGSAIQAAMPIIQGIITVIMTIGSVVVPALLAGFEAFSAGISAVMSAIQGIFQGLITFITGVFSGSWSQAWEGIKQIFGSAFDGLVALCKAPLNAVIAIINKAISGINGLGLTIPEWVPILGGKSFSVNIPTLPMLARGGFTDGVSIAGEAGTEAVISFQRGVRSDNINTWTQAGRMLGVSGEQAAVAAGVPYADGGGAVELATLEATQGNNAVELQEIDTGKPQPEQDGGGTPDGGGQVVFAPQITVQGNADRAVLESVLDDAQQRFELWYEQMMRRKARTAY